MNLETLTLETEVYIISAVLGKMIFELQSRTFVLLFNSFNFYLVAFFTICLQYSTDKILDAFTLSLHLFFAHES